MNHGDASSPSLFTQDRDTYVDNKGLVLLDNNYKDERRMSSTVRLSIKAANGSVGDYSVEAQGDWTVHQLKNHLYRHYPTHPVSQSVLQ